MFVHLKLNQCNVPGCKNCSSEETSLHGRSIRQLLKELEDSKTVQNSSELWLEGQPLQQNTSGLQ